MTAIGFELQMGSQFGYGVTTLDLLTHLFLQGRITPLILSQPAEMTLSPTQEIIVNRLLRIQKTFFEQLPQQNSGRIVINYPVLVPIGNGFSLSSNWGRFKGTASYAKIVFEHTLIDLEASKRLQEYDALFPVSNWNMNVLRNAGLDHVSLTPEGIDPTIFHPAPRCGIWHDRFVIFSAGKFQYRKAQDLVATAFKFFHQRHSDSLLCFCWHNLWPQAMIDMNVSPFTKKIPTYDDRGIDFTSWLLENDLKKNSFVDLGFVNHYQLPQVIRETDVAIFPNRCEGGTNLMAMETMACSVPVILSANTGHLDLISGDNVFTLNDQGDVTPPNGWKGTDGWGESSVEEIVETMEYVYQHRTEAKRRAAYASRWIIKERSWDKCAKQFTNAIQKYL